LVPLAHYSGRKIVLLAMHDCAPEARLREGRWEVLIFPHNADDARMFPVPAHAVLPREKPDGGLSFAGHRMDLSVASFRRPAPNVS
jgi:hypothetical protein